MYVCGATPCRFVEFPSGFHCGFIAVHCGFFAGSALWSEHAVALCMWRHTASDRGNSTRVLKYRSFIEEKRQNIDTARNDPSATVDT